MRLHPINERSLFYGLRPDASLRATVAAHRRSGLCFSYSLTIKIPPSGGTVGLHTTKATCAGSAYLGGAEGY
jgi:hypothetical protein